MFSPSVLVLTDNGPLHITGDTVVVEYLKSAYQWDDRHIDALSCVVLAGAYRSLTTWFGIYSKVSPLQKIEMILAVERLVAR